MISKTDFMGYFNEILTLENQMQGVYLGLSKSIEHPEYKRFFEKMAKEENGHAELVNHLIEIFK